MASSINDFIQGIIMLFGIVAVIMAVLNDNGGFVNSLAGLAKVEDASVSDVPGVFASFFGPDPVNLFAVVILTSLGTWGLPQMVQKFYAIKDEKAISKGTIISTFFAVIVAGGCYFLGGFGRLYSDKVDVVKDGFDSIIPSMLQNMPDLLIGIVVVLVLSASMSTLSALVMTSSSTLTLDVIKGVFVKKMDEKKQLLTIRCFIAVFVIISMIIAIVQQKSHTVFIAQLMGISWGALAGAFLAPFLYGLYWKKTTTASVWVSFILGAGIMICNMLFKSYFPVALQSPINCGAFAMVAGLIIVPLVSLFTKAPGKKSVEKIFSCIKD